MEFNLRKISPVIVEDDDFYCQIEEKEEKGAYIPLKLDKYTINQKNNILSGEIEDKSISKKSLLGEISSKYIIENINSYIKDDNCIYKLIKYNKSLQKKLNILLVDYKERYYNKNIKWEKWINIKSEELKKREEYYKEKDFNYFIFKYYQNYKKEEIYKSNIYLYITSPFLYTLARLENFGEIFIFNINLNDERKDYVINRINRLNINSLSIIFRYRSISELCNLKERFLDFSKIKKLKFNTWEKYNPSYDSTEKYYPFFKYIFSMKSLLNNLIYLKFEFMKGNIKGNYIQRLNELKSLKYLKLTRLNPDDTFALKLNNLETLTLRLCTNIAFKDEISLSLKHLKIKECSLVKITKDYHLQCPSLESCLFQDGEGLNHNQYINFIIDLSSMVNLKSFVGPSKYFMSLGKSLIEKIKIKIAKGEDYNINDIFQKICGINTLKEVHFYPSNFGKEILSVQKVNSSIQKIIISERKENRIFDEERNYSFKEIFSNLIRLLSLVPNLADFYLDIYYWNYNFEEDKFKEFIERILKMDKIKKVNICIEYTNFSNTGKEKVIYTINKLAELFPEANLNKFEEIYIVYEKPLQSPENVNKRKNNNEMCCFI